MSILKRHLYPVLKITEQVKEEIDASEVERERESLMPQHALMHHIRRLPEYKYSIGEY